MKLIYLLPFSYFYITRLSKGDLLFHVVFEWLAAICLVLFLGASSVGVNIFLCVLSYLAFISLYEIGYIVNDLVASKYEQGGRRRGPQGVGNFWVVTWTCSRVLVFLLVTHFSGFMLQVEWWSFYVALCSIFALHNIAQDKKIKVVTFQWLALLRFMAPVIFVLEDKYILGVGLATIVSYGTFRMLGYLDSKELLVMPNRKDDNFRLFIFCMPLAGTVVLWSYETAKGYIILSVYFAVAAFFGICFRSYLSRKVT